MKHSNEAARDLWSQIFERAAAEANAALFIPDEETEASQKKMADQALRVAGWSEVDIKRRNAAELPYVDIKTLNSPGVAPYLEIQLKELADHVRNAISETGETSQENVEIGIDSKSGVSASLTNVIMTDQGILSVSAFLFRWCGLIARAYTRTLHANLEHWTSKTPCWEDDYKIILNNTDLALYWFRIFASFSETGTHFLVPYRPATPKELTLFEQVAWAMEYFTVAHEFGHHVLGHRDINEDPISQEFQADMFAARVSERLEFKPFPSIPNPYTRTGAGGSIMLLAMEILRSFENREADNSISVQTHPVAKDRIERISMRNLLLPKQLEMDLEYNRTIARMMNAVAAAMQSCDEAGGNEFIAKIRSTGP